MVEGIDAGSDHGGNRARRSLLLAAPEQDAK